MGNMREISIEECNAVFGGTEDIVVTGTRSDRFFDASIYLNYTGNYGNDSTFFGGGGGPALDSLLPEVAGDFEDGEVDEGDDDRDGILNRDEEIVVTGAPLNQPGNDSGYFGCVGTGAFGAVVGGCLGSNPFDGYVYGGVGSPGPSVNGGYATDTSTYLTGAGASYVSPVGVGAGTTLNGEAAAVVVGTPGTAVTYGVSVTEIYNDVIEGLGEIADDATKAFVDHYYPDIEELGQPPEF